MPTHAISFSSFRTSERIKPGEQIWMICYYNVSGPRAARVLCKRSRMRTHAQVEQCVHTHLSRRSNSSHQAQATCFGFASNKRVFSFTLCVRQGHTTWPYETRQEMIGHTCRHLHETTHSCFTKWLAAPTNTSRGIGAYAYRGPVGAHSFL